MLRYFLVFFCVLAAHALHAQLVVKSIDIEGNAVTKPRIILREIPFEVGDTTNTTALGKQLFRSESSLRSSGLFNFVEVRYILQDGSNEVAISIKVVERWYLWPVPILENAEPNFNTWWQHKRLDRTNYGIDFLWNNFRGRRERLRLLLRQGFTEQLTLQYEVPYLNKNGTVGLAMQSGYLRSREVNSHSTNSTRDFTRTPDAYLQETGFAEVTVLRHFGIARYVTLTGGFQTTSIADTLQQAPFNYLPNDQRTSAFMYATLGFKADRRDYLHYPTYGYMLEAELTKTGLGALQNAPNLLELTGGLHGHKKFGKGKSHLSAAVIWKWNLLDYPPYFLQRGLGYQSKAIRGYELYVIDGQSYALLKTGWRWRLLNTKRISLPILNKYQFSETLLQVYAGPHFDVGYVDDVISPTRNPLGNSWQYGAGVGIDFVTYYDKVIRFEFSVNKLGESGFFVHFTKPV